MNNVKKKTIESTMPIETRPKVGFSRGTGFRYGSYVNQVDLILSLITNKHVVDGAESLKVYFSLSEPKDHDIKIGSTSSAPFFNGLNKTDKSDYGIMSTDRDLIDNQYIIRAINN